MKNIIYIIAILSFSTACIGQVKSKQEFPEIGKPMPDFVLTDVVNYKTRQVSLKNFMGKWLFLDFWSRYCTACVESFPKYDALQKQFGDQIQFVYVGMTGEADGSGTHLSTNEAVRLIYKKAKERLKLTIPFAFDSTLVNSYNIGGMPYIIIIDPKGIVRGITLHLDAANITDFLNGKQPVLEKAYRKNEAPKYDTNLPFLTYNNAGSDTSFLFRSLFTKLDDDALYAEIWEPQKGKVEFIKNSLEHMLLRTYFGDWFFSTGTALYGKVYPEIIYEGTKIDKSGVDSAFQKVRYGYSLIVPVSRVKGDFVTNYIKRDLNNYFDIDVSIESRRMSYWKLVASESAKSQLKTKGVKSWKEFGAAGFVSNNFPISNLIDKLAMWFQYQIFIDETGISDNIDITINAQLTDFEDFHRALRENGLDLVKGEKEMKVLVIRDAKN